MDESSNVNDEDNDYVKAAAAQDTLAMTLMAESKEIQTKRQVSDMIKPLIAGFSENTIHMNKLQHDHDSVEARVKALEVVFNGGQGQNYIYDKLLAKIADEVSTIVI